jgi:hypothetical protein
MANREDQIGALWLSDTKGMLKGEVNGVRIVAFKNKYKTDGDNRPVLTLFKSVKQVAQDPPEADDDEVMPF